MSKEIQVESEVARVFGEFDRYLRKVAALPESLEKEKILENLCWKLFILVMKLRYNAEDALDTIYKSLLVPPER
jgi:hypothetical protein